MTKPKTIPDLERRVLAAVGRLCPAKGRIGLGVSGGLDSMVLAEALRRSGLQPLCLHVNHGWRGKQSDGDAQFVENWCRKQQFPFVCKTLTAKVPRTEAAAREARWQFFFAMLKKRRITVLLLAHHADDLVETFLLQLLRGAGPDGLAGLQESREMDGVKVLRPLLAFSKKELQSLAKHWRLAWREDASNRSDDYFRNRVRRQLLPYLQKLSGRDPLTVIRRTAQIIADENAFWERELPRVWGSRLALKIFAGKAVAWKRRALRSWLVSQGVTNADFEQIEAVRGLLEREKPSRVNLSGDRFCCRRAGYLLIEGR
jgi:tRNA(Ile)-lysidine synthetase-like protein